MPDLAAEIERKKRELEVLQRRLEVETRTTQQRNNVCMARAWFDKMLAAHCPTCPTMDPAQIKPTYNGGEYDHNGLRMDYHCGETWHLGDHDYMCSGSIAHWHTPIVTLDHDRLTVHSPPAAVPRT